MTDLVTDILLFLVLFCLMAVLFSIQRGFNQVIRGLTAIHQRLGDAEGKDPSKKS